MVRGGPPQPEDLTQFVAAFKEMASHLDEDGARNLLLWSPLFMPTVDGLMRNGGDPGARGPKPRLKAGMPHEARHAPPQVSTAVAERAAHIAKMRQMYAACGAAPVAEEAPSYSAEAPCGQSPTPPWPPPADPTAPPWAPLAEPSAPRAAYGYGGPPLEDEWEDEVDDLLDWTTTLPGGAPGSP